MVASGGHGSRAASVHSASGVHTIMKKRNKQYKTEQHSVTTKRRKLNLRTSFMDTPQGFTFLEIGTPDLAELCKELSRQRGLPVNVVNGQPLNNNALYSNKVSHHVHRIGYHFKSEVVEEACEKLNYIFLGKKFVKVADIQRQNNDSVIASVMARHGAQWNQPMTQRETPDQVRAAIKELFPRIPENDLNQIIEHAWKAGTNRVGNNLDLALPRRVQLATIARIRHEYTDYDRLLKAFGTWEDIRREVEPECLKKLIEWRGENDDDDEALEEIVRETIVIDDDSDGVEGNASEADDEDSVSEAEHGNASDTSIEITHREAVGDDLRAEDPNERNGWHRKLQQQQQRTVEQRTQYARQIISDQRRAQQGRAMRPVPPARSSPQPYRHAVIGDSNTVARSGPPGSHLQPQLGSQLRQVITDQFGRELVSALPELEPQSARAYAPQHQAHGASRMPDQLGSHAATQQLAEMRHERSKYNHAVQSIERVEDTQPPYSGPGTPLRDQNQRSAYPHRRATPPDSNQHKRMRLEYAPSMYEHTVPTTSNTIDLTTPERWRIERGPLPPDVARVSQYADPGREVAARGTIHDRAVGPFASYALSLPQHFGQQQSSDATYEPQKTFLTFPGHYHGQQLPARPAHASASCAEPAPPQASQPPYYGSGWAPAAHSGGQTYVVPSAYGYPQQAQQQTGTPVHQPVHGAPAAVQQRPRQHVTQVVPINGAPAPTQYYWQRQ